MFYHSEQGRMQGVGSEGKCNYCDFKNNNK